MLRLTTLLLTTAVVFSASELGRAETKKLSATDVVVGNYKLYFSEKANYEADPVYALPTSVTNTRAVIEFCAANQSGKRGYVKLDYKTDVSSFLLTNSRVRVPSNSRNCGN